MRPVATVLLAFVLLPHLASAATIHVPGDRPTIQAGLDAAAAGDTVEVACGTYYEHDIVMKSGVCLRSETGEPSCVTVDGQGLGRVFYCQTLSTVTKFEGLTITGGRAAGTAPASFGGGMYCNLAYHNVVRCVFHGNSAYSGGGVHCRDNCNVALTSCTFYDNSASWAGGAIYAGHESPVVVTGCTISGNRGNEGGGIYLFECYATIENTIVASSTQGEAVGCYTAVATLSCCDVYGNAGGDWENCIAGQDTVRGNLSADPVFCDAGAGDFHLDCQSPCAPAQQPECGLIGAYGVGCGASATEPSTWGLLKQLFKIPGR